MEVDQQKRNFIEKTHESILNEERKALANEMQKLGQKDTAIKNKKVDVAPTSFRAQLKESIFEEDDCEEIYTPGAMPVEETPTTTATASTVVEEPEEPVELPAVRQGQKDHKIGFTEKKFAHLPARESQLKEPPYPKSKNLETKKGENLYIEADDKDPVWLKDKGDLFFKRSDYHAAINAYTKALTADKDFISGRLNRATCYIKTRNFNLCVDDINDIVT
jgi:dyslexia susceptibility 1 candidate gene 1 protein